MKKSTKGEAVFSACQIQATRRNHLEYRRLQQNVNLMQDDLRSYLARLDRQAQNIREHYTNVVRVVQPNPASQLWKQVHTYERGQDQTRTWQGSKSFFSFLYLCSYEKMRKIFDLSLHVIGLRHQMNICYLRSIHLYR